jgi:hypothetical protein
MKDVGTILVDQNIVRIPTVVGVAANMLAPIYHQYTLAGRRHPFRESSASESRADYNPVSFHQSPNVCFIGNISSLEGLLAFFGSRHLGGSLVRHQMTFHQYSGM